MRAAALRTRCYTVLLSCHVTSHIVIPLCHSNRTPPPNERGVTAGRRGARGVGAGDDEVAAAGGEALAGTRARHDASGDAGLAALLFEASLAAMDSWNAASTVRQASHSLDGHECDHDHAGDAGDAHDGHQCDHDHSPGDTHSHD